MGAVHRTHVVSALQVSALQMSALQMSALHLTHVVERVSTIELCEYTPVYAAVL